jgi:hypothetical protein
MILEWLTDAGPIDEFRAGSESPEQRLMPNAAFVALDGLDQAHGVSANSLKLYPFAA